MPEATELELTAESMDAYVSLFGMNDRNIALIEQECNVSIALRRNHLVITGEEKDRELAGQVITLLLEMIHRNENVDRIRIRYTIAMVREGKVSQIEENLKNGVPYVIRQKMPLEGKTGFDDLIYGRIEVDNKELYATAIRPTAEPVTVTLTMKCGGHTYSAGIPVTITQGTEADNNG